MIRVCSITKIRLFQRGYEMSKIGYTDKPVEKITEDSFGIKTYIGGLCEFIVSCDTPMTISIQGDWGSGKTSMMNMIKKEVEEKVYPIWFNTWQYSQFNMGNDLCISFLENLINKLHSKAENRNSKILEASLKILKIGAKTAIGAVGLDGALVDVFEKGGSDIAKAVTDLKDAFQDSVNDKLEESKKDRVVIFVDDLDRLNPAKAVELLEVLKVFLDCQNCVFILAVDYNVVTTGVRQKFGELVGDEKGKSFFDKIIQLPFKMPVAQYDIKKYIYDMLIKMDMKADPRTLYDYRILIKNSIGFNPRSIKRLFNTYQLLNLISTSKTCKVEEEVRQKLLFATICMQMSFDNLYATIVNSAKNNELTGKMLRGLADANAVRNYDGLPEELGLLDKDNNINEDQLSKVCNFMKAFVATVDLDKSMLLSDEEMANLKEILFFSSVTSVMADIKDSSGTDDEQKLRARNKAIIDEVDHNLTATIGDFNVWQPRKASADTRLSDVNCYIDLTTKAGTPFTFEFGLTSKNHEYLSMIIKLYSVDFADKLKQSFEDNPLSYEIPPVLDEQGYIYPVIELPVLDAAVYITEKIQQAYNALKAKGFLA